jgi:hypothetical protein
LGFGFEPKSILTKLWFFSENWRDWMLDYCSLHDFQHVCAFVLTKSSMNLSQSCWVHSGLCLVFFMLFIFLCVWFILFKFFFFFCVFMVLASLIYFLALVLFSSQTRIFGLIYGRTKDFGSTQSSQPSRIKSIESKKSESKGL